MGPILIICSHLLQEIVKLNTLSRVHSCSVSNTFRFMATNGFAPPLVFQVGGLALTSMGVQSRHDPTALSQQFPAWHSISGHSPSYKVTIHNYYMICFYQQ